MVSKVGVTKKKDAADQEDLMDRIGDDIYLGKLAPGMWLKQIDLERRYDCTRLSLRHALEHLSSRKIVEKAPNRGFYVPTFELEFIRKIADARARIEMSIAEDLTELVTEESLQRMTVLANEYSEMIRTGTIEAQDKANFAFHAEMLSTSPNDIITNTIWSLRRRIPLLVQREFNTPVRLEKSAQQHLDMIDCLRNKDAERLKTTISDHIRGHYVT